MIRFPNPGSDIPSFIRIYKTLYTYLNEKSWFTLDDMSETLTKMNLAASSGHVGEQALALSTRADRSRDPLYNQSKMYAELYRTLGWMVSDAPDAALKFRFTLLGDHAAVADIDPRAIFEESILGINYPNRILAIKGTEASRTFSAILKVAAKLDGYICRDEIIIGILNNDDVGDDGIVALIKSLRGSASRLSNAISELSKQIKIQINTMQNYTRFPLAVLTYCGWFEKESTKKFYSGGRPTVMFRLTEYGQERANELETLSDIRLDDYDSHTTEKQKSLVRLGFYSMLQRSNFDISPAIAQIAKDQNFLGNEITDGAVLFSPYQTIRPEVADNALGHVREQSVNISSSISTSSSEIIAVEKTAHKVTTIKLNQVGDGASAVKVESEIATQIRSLIQTSKTDKEIADILHVENAKTSQPKFYPLIADLFRIIGFNCQATRAGINYERWDAIAIDDEHSIPIEIKSPTEEWNISIKAIRQALENKVILLSRKSYKTDWDSVTLAVGYNLPNDRAEVSRLIADIKNTFNIKVGVIDFRSLLTIASASLRGDKGDRVSEIRKMEGLINVESV